MKIKLNNNYFKMQKRLKRCLDDVESSEEVVRTKKQTKRTGENPEHM